MTHADIHRRELQDSFLRLGSRQRIAFAALCAERLLPYYRIFSKVERWGSYGRLRDALDTIWSFAEGMERPSAEWTRLIAECRQVVPDTEEFEGPLVSRALDASSAVIVALQLCVEPSVPLLNDVAQIAIDAAIGVEQFQTADDLDRLSIGDVEQFQNLVLSGRVQDELSIQSAMVEALRKDDRIDAEALKKRFGGPM